MRTAHARARRPWHGDSSFLKLVVFINSLIPLALLILDVAQGTAGPEPTRHALHTTGLMAVIFLLLTLAITPLRLITGANWLSHFRRMLGLFAFFYACLHLSIYFVFDRSLSITSLIGEVKERRFILFGMCALLLMLPLAITSTNPMIKRLGAANWKRLHWLVYPAAILAMLHYWNATKLVETQQRVAVGVLVGLLGYRGVVKLFPSLRYRRAVDSSKLNLSKSV